MFSFLKRIRLNQQAAGYAEYAIILGLLGSSAVFMVSTFGQSFIQLLIETNDVIEDYQDYGATQGNPFLTLEDAFLPDGQQGTAFTYNLNNHLYQTGFLPGAPAPHWAEGTLGTGLPDGLTLNTQTGQINGTPTTAGLYAFEINVIRQDSIAIQEYLLTIDP